MYMPGRRLLGGQSDDLSAVRDEQRVLLHDERAHVGRGHASEGALQFGLLAHLEGMQCHPQRPGRRLHLVQLRLVDRIRRIGQIANLRELWHSLLEQLQPLGHQLAVARSQAGEVAARPGEAGHRTNLDGLTHGRKDDGELSFPSV